MTETATDIAAEVRAGTRTARAVAAEYLARAAAYDAVQPQVWIARLADEEVLARAAAIDARVASGEALPLAGVPFAIKDNIDLAGTPTTAACPAFVYTPATDASVVARLIGAGALPLGKTNLDQFATGLTGARSPHGAVGCAFNRAFISGGSSSGSAVATAAGLVAFALGTDTAGSGRVPAAFNGLIGFKPTRGRWSTRGVVPACRSLDCVSVLTTSLADATLIDEVLTGYDAADVWSRAVPEAVETGQVRRLGVPRAGQLDWCGDGEGPGLFAAALAGAQASGVEVVEVDIAPLLECARLLYQGPWVAERAGVVAGLLASQPGAIHPVVRAILQAGAAVTAVEAFAGFHALKGYERAAQALWREADALLLPTTPRTYRIAEVLAEPYALNANLGLYTNFVNLLDMAAIAVPVGWRADASGFGATGFGVSFIGPAWSEARLAEIAGRFLAARPNTPPALDLAPRAPGVRLAVVGAHLAGMPLHWQLTSRGARFVGAGRTAAAYRLYVVAGSRPPKPALIAQTAGGAAIEVEIYELDEAAFGSFVAEVPAPLAIGAVTLEDGETVRGFVGEARATEGAQDITHLGGWRRFIAERGG